MSVAKRWLLHIHAFATCHFHARHGGRSAFASHLHSWAGIRRHGKLHEQHAEKRDTRHDKAGWEGKFHKVISLAQCSILASVGVGQSNSIDSFACEYLKDI